MKKIIAFVVSMTLALGLLAAASGEAYQMKLSAPAGAPALTVAVPAAENPELYTFLDASTIGAEFQKNEADFIIAPINAGATLYKKGASSYRLAAVVTWGNLFFASQKEGFSEESLKGADLVLFGENTINASVVLAVLEARGITPGSVNYLAGAAETQAELLNNPDAVVVTADPAVTAARIKNEKVSVISVQEMLKEALGMDGYAQAGLFVRAETAENYPEETKAYLETVKEAAGMAQSDPEKVAEAAVRLEILPNAKIALAAIPGCSIRFVSAPEAREAVEKTAGINLAQYGGELPADDFYYVTK